MLFMIVRKNLFLYVTCLFSFELLWHQVIANKLNYCAK